MINATNNINSLYRDETKPSNLIFHIIGEFSIKIEKLLQVLCEDK